MKESSRTSFAETRNLLPAFDLWRAYVKMGSEAAHASAGLLATTGKAFEHIQRSQLDMLRTWETLSRTPGLGHMKALAEATTRNMGRTTREMSKLTEDGADLMTDVANETVTKSAKSAKSAAKALKAHRPKRTAKRGRKARS